MLLSDNVIAFNLVMGLITIYETFFYYVSKLFFGQTKAITKYTFKKVAGVEVVDKDEKKQLSRGDIQILNEDFYPRLIGFRSLGLGESYMEGWWDCDDLEELFYKIFKSKFTHVVDPLGKLHRFHDYLRFNLFNLQTQARSFEVGQKHYDQSNEMFKAMLDKSMTYSCAYWKNAKNLDEAQENKMDLLARKLQLKPGMRVLDIGCGWGGLCKYLASKYGVQMVGVTVSTEGARVGQERNAGLPVDIRVQDFRDFPTSENGTFDRVVSVGMFEHVGQSNYRTFFEVSHRLLKDDGFLVLHTIGSSSPETLLTDPWFNTYIFPNGIIPYHTHMTDHTDGLFVIEDWQSMGHHYYRTLMAWNDNFKRAWPVLKGNYKEPEKFYRMWIYYLQLSAANFRARTLQLWQIVYSKNGIPGGYEAPR